MAEKSSEPPAKRLKALAPNEIKTLALFNSCFPSYKITNKGKHDFQCASGWDSPQGKELISEWLKVVSEQQIQMYSRISRNSESSLYPLIITTLLPVFDLCDFSATAKVVFERDEDTMALLASSIAQSQSAQSSIRSSLDQPGAKEAASEPNTPLLPDTVNTTNEDEVLAFMVYVEKYIGSKDFPAKGRVEMVIRNERTQKDSVVIEAKPKISNGLPDDAGFYQLCAYMVLGDIKFGIYTDHTSFQFVYVDEGKVFHHTRITALLKPALDRLDEEATTVYAYMFEMFGVPRDTEILEKAIAGQANWKERAAQLCANLR